MDNKHLMIVNLNLNIISTNSQYINVITNTYWI